MRAFISYSHNDEASLRQLATHLAMLRRENKLSEWIDQKILVGGEIDKEVSRELDSCELFMPLVSPEFLASNYCYDVEMKRAMERHEAGTMRIVPIIIEPCDWKASPLKRFKVLPRDGKPVAEWTNKNNAYLDVVTELRRLMDETGTSPVPNPKTEELAKSKPEGSRRYRVKRDFDEIDKKDFRMSAFNKMRDYFKAASAEIDAVDEIRARFELIGSDGFTCTVVNRSRRNGAAHITVYAGGGRITLGDITYSFQENAERNTANGWYSVENDEYDLFLSASNFGRNEQKRLTPETAAEALWEDFLEHAGIAHE